MLAVFFCVNQTQKTKEFRKAEVEAERMKRGQRGLELSQERKFRTEVSPCTAGTDPRGVDAVGGGAVEGSASRAPAQPRGFSL